MVCPCATPVPESFHYRRPKEPYSPKLPPSTHRVENGRLVARGGLVERHARRVEAVARDPRSLTLREFASVVFLGFGLWRLWVLSLWLGVFYGLPGMCWRAGLACPFYFIGRLLDLVWAWLEECAGWAMLGAGVVFVTEAVLG